MSSIYIPQSVFKNYDRPQKRNIYIRSNTISQYCDKDMNKFRRELEQKRAAYHDDVNPQKWPLKIMKNAVATAIPYVPQEKAYRNFLGLSGNIGSGMTNSQFYENARKYMIVPDSQISAQEADDNNLRNNQLNAQLSVNYDDDGEGYGGKLFRNANDRSITAPRDVKHGDLKSPYLNFMYAFIEKYPQRPGEPASAYNTRVVETGVNIFKSMPLSFWDFADVSFRIDHVVAMKTKQETDPNRALYDLTNDIRDEKIVKNNENIDNNNEQYVDEQATIAASTPEFERELVHDEVKNKIEAKAVASDVAMKERLIKDNPAVYSHMLKDLLEADHIRRDKLTAKQDNDIKTSIIGNFPQIFEEIKKDNPTFTTEQVIKKIYETPIEQFVEQSKKFIKTTVTPGSDLSKQVKDEELTRDAIFLNNQLFDIDNREKELGEVYKDVDEKFNNTANDILELEKKIKENENNILAFDANIAPDLEEHERLKIINRGKPETEEMAKLRNKLEKGEEELRGIEETLISDRSKLENLMKKYNELDEGKRGLDLEINQLNKMKNESDSKLKKIIGEQKKITPNITELIDNENKEGAKHNFITRQKNEIFFNALSKSYKRFIDNPSKDNLETMLSRLYNVSPSNKDNNIDFAVPASDADNPTASTINLRMKDYEKLYDKISSDVSKAIKIYSPYIEGSYDYQSLVNKISSGINTAKPADGEEENIIKLSTQFKDRKREKLAMFEAPKEKAPAEYKLKTYPERSGEEIKEIAQKEARGRVSKMQQLAKNAASINILDEEKEKEKQRKEEEERKIKEEEDKRKKEYEEFLEEIKLKKQKLATEKPEGDTAPAPGSPAATPTGSPKVAPAAAATAEEKEKEKEQPPVQKNIDVSDDEARDYRSSAFEPSLLTEQEKDAILKEYESDYEKFINESRKYNDSNVINNDYENFIFRVYDSNNKLSDDVIKKIQNSDILKGRTEISKAQGFKFIYSQFGDKHYYIFNTTDEEVNDLVNKYPSYFDSIDLFNKSAKEEDTVSDSKNNRKYIVFKPKFIEEYILNDGPKKITTSSTSTQQTPRILTNPTAPVSDTKKKFETITPPPVHTKDDYDKAAEIIKKMQKIEGYDKAQTITNQPAEIKKMWEEYKDSPVKKIITEYFKKVKSNVGRHIESVVGSGLPQTKAGQITFAHKRDLSQYGYNDIRNLSEQQRHDALDKALDGFYKKEGGKTSLLRKLNALAIVNKNRDPDLAAIFKSDSNYVGTK